jgi:hypothetical protein
VFSGWPMDASGTVQTNWTGTWHGMLEAYPEGEVGAGWNSRWEIGTYPRVDNSCTIWRIIYTVNGTVQATKDNRFCRGRGSDDLFIAEGGGGKVAVQWINDMLVSAFKHTGVFAVARMRMRGDTLEEQILTTDDNPGIENVVVSVRAHSIHSIRMKRMSASSSGEKCFRSSRLVYIVIFLIARWT